MSSEQSNLANRSLKRRKLRDVTVVLPLLGIFLFLTPIPAVFVNGSQADGIPSIFLYIYGVWAILIIACAFLSKKLQSFETSDPYSPPEPK